MLYSVVVRNARLNATADAVGPAPVLEIRSGPEPDRCSDVDTGDLLGSLTLPRAWMTDAIDGVMTMSDLWSSGVCSGTGEPGHFRVKSNGACHIQGSVSDPDGDGEMIVSDLLFVVGRVFTVIGFALTAGNGGR